MHAPRRPETDEILLGENLELLPEFADGSFQLIYIDPPFNTGRAQTRRTLRTAQDAGGDRTGFSGRRYSTRLLAESSYRDSFEDYLAFLRPRLSEARRLLAREGTLYVHLDWREAHYCKLLLDELFGRECFLNEIVWAYDYGARTKRSWPTKHDTILVYVKDPKAYHFDSEAVDREPYMAPGLVTAEKAARGKLPTDVWWHTIVPTGGHEKTGYPTQKPLGIVRRMVQASTREGDWCLDFFAGSGTLGAAAARLGRRYVLIDSNPEAVRIMRERLGERAQPPGRHAAREPQPWPRRASLGLCFTSRCASSRTTPGAFNLGEDELLQFVVPWSREQWIELGRTQVEPAPGPHDRARGPAHARRRTLDGSRLAQRSAPLAGRDRARARAGTRAPAGRAGRCRSRCSRAAPPGRPVRALTRARQVPPTRSSQSLLGSDPQALLEAWRLAAERRPELTPSESLALAERTLSSLDS